MTGQITMYDTAQNALFPSGAAAYAAYVDGHVDDQPNFDYIVAAFPHAEHLSITVFPGVDAMCLDIEPGAASPEDAASWYAQQRARGLQRPCLYASVDEMAAFVLPLVEAAGIARSSVRLWTAHYDAGEHICGPATCGQILVDADGTQWTSTAGGGALDQSLLNPGFFAVPPPPPPPAAWTYGAPLNLQAAGGHTSVRLNWKPPVLDGHPAPAGYQVWVYEGEECSRATLVPTYPRPVRPARPGEPAPVSWEGGGLAEGRSYTAHVVASGADGTRIRPYTFAFAGFATG